MENETFKSVGTASWIEGPLTEKIENETAKIPSDYFLFGAIGMMGLSLVCKLTGNDHKSLFFGQWVAPILLLGVYNKIVKTHGHDKHKEGEIDEASY